jgi:light-regulated signal transduction histidine kinase (bacteriophytochrome)
MVWGNRVKLLQVLQNLIENAVKFRSEAPPQVHISARQENDKWVFSVKDNGIGFSMDYVGRIFQPFRRLHSVDDYRGAGIGLSICKKIVEQHGGRIWAESTPGAGSAFFFTLPSKLKYKER